MIVRDRIIEMLDSESRRAAFEAVGL